MFPVPTSVFLTHGVGTSRQQLSAFEDALRDADIEQQNLVIGLLDPAAALRTDRRAAPASPCCAPARSHFA